jgi:hypothetical protein
MSCYDSRTVPSHPFRSLPKTKAGFVEPLDCLPVSKLPEGPQWVWEILCGPPHISSVASAVMWRLGCGLG